MKSNIYAVKIKNEDLYSAMNNLVEALPFPEEAKCIGIKLNLCNYRTWESGATSDPAVVSSLLEILRDKYPNSKILLLENNATETLADNLFPYLGYDIIAEKYDCTLINVAHEEYIEKKISGLHFDTLEVPQVIDQCDMFINHPKLKTHGKTKITCGLKNMYGFYKVKKKSIYHPFLDDAIVDINLAIRSDFTIVDGNICLEGNNGPTFGIPKKVGLFIGGNDFVAVDTFCAKLMGFNPYFVTPIIYRTGIFLVSCFQESAHGTNGWRR